jgi:hypothetical protein
MYLLGYSLESCVISLVDARALFELGSWLMVDFRSAPPWIASVNNRHKIYEKRRWRDMFLVGCLHSISWYMALFTGVDNTITVATRNCINPNSRQIVASSTTVVLKQHGY